MDEEIFMEGEPIQLQGGQVFNAFRVEAVLRGLKQNKYSEVNDEVSEPVRKKLLRKIVQRYVLIPDSETVDSVLNKITSFSVCTPDDEVDDVLKSFVDNFTKTTKIEWDATLPVASVRYRTNFDKYGFGQSESMINVKLFAGVQFDSDSFKRACDFLRAKGFTYVNDKFSENTPTVAYYIDMLCSRISFKKFLRSSVDELRMCINQAHQEANSYNNLVALDMGTIPLLAITEKEASKVFDTWEATKLQSAKEFKEEMKSMFLKELSKRATAMRKDRMKKRMLNSPYSAIGL